jgi:hypothetical protein
LLKEIERLRGLVHEKDDHIEVMGSELRALPSLVEARASLKLIAKAQDDVKNLEKENSELRN